MKKVCVATAREVGKRCQDIAREILCGSEDYVLTENMHDCDIFVSVLYDKIVSPDFINQRICYNFHPGILPEYRGAGTFSWSIINKETEAGITLHLIDEGIDSGDIIEIKKFPILEHDTAADLFEKGEELIVEMFTERFEDLLSGAVVPVPQDENRASLYYRKDLNQALDLTNLIRGLFFPGKESPYFIDQNGEKKHIHYQEENNEN